MTNILKYRHLFSAVTALILLIACNNELELPEKPIADSPGTITLHLKNSNLSRSVDSENAENAIKKLYVGLYPNSSEEEDPAMFWYESEDIDESGSCTVTIPLSDEIISDLFGDNPQTGDECKFFVIANYFGPDAVSEYASVRELKNLLVKTEFMSEDQTSFVMVDEGTAAYTAPEAGEKIGKVSGIASLIRAAAKIRLNIKFNKPVTTTDTSGNVITWTPITDNNAIKVLINNGVDEAITVPEYDDSPWYPGSTPETGGDLEPGGGLGILSESVGLDENPGLEIVNEPDPYYSSSLKVEKSVRFMTKNDLDEEYPYQMDIPFYTYPNAWKETPEETHKTTLTLIVPWHREGDPEGSNYTLYYQVPVSRDYYDVETKMISITRNTSYNIYLNIGMLGNITPDDPKELDDLSYRIVDWSDETLPVNIPNNRYLVVSPNVYTINNEAEFSIPFFTSHDTEIYDITMTYQRFNYFCKEVVDDDGDWVKNPNYGDVVEIPIPKRIIDKSQSTYINNGNIVTEKICDYYIDRDPISREMVIKIRHPFTMWVPLDTNNNPVSFNLQRAPLANKISRITHYAYPTSGYYIDSFYDDDEDVINERKYTEEPAYFPYKFTIKIRHKDNHLFNETVTVTQYPGMYIVADKNTGGSYLSYNPYKTTLTADNYNYGYTFLNPQKTIYNGFNLWKNADNKWEMDNYDKAVEKYIKQHDDESLNKILEIARSYKEKALGGLRPYDNITTVGNPNMYVINITQLSKDDGKYIIGDPRSKFINNDLSGETGELKVSSAEAGEWCQEATSITGEIRRLRYYYPTNEDQSYNMMVAPKIRVASAYGTVRVQSDIINATIGRRRVATYQEQGRPAGRWRLPTYGEVSFIVKLAAEYKIPVLFLIGETYLTAQGPYKIENNGTLSKSSFNYKFEWNANQNKWLAVRDMGVYVRGVYDEWYWGDETISQKDIYTYGDKPINSN